MKNKILLLLFSCVVSFSSYSQISEEYQLKEANKAVMIWFNNLNTGNYPGSWEGLSFEITNRFDSIDWVVGVEQMMISFGDFNGRNEVSREFKSSWEGLPDGYYAVFQYESKYNHTVKHSEQLILHQDDKRNWMVLDYSYDFIDRR